MSRPFDGRRNGRQGEHRDQRSSDSVRSLLCDGAPSTGNVHHNYCGDQRAHQGQRHAHHPADQQDVQMASDHGHSSSRGASYPSHHGHNHPSSMLYQGAASSGLPADYRDPYMAHHGQSFSSHQFPSSAEQLHAQESLLRSTQASIQMMYDVFDYTIGMLEELEKHEPHGKKGQKCQNSGILSHLIPMNHKKPEAEVVAGIEAELLCLSIQMRYSPKDVINEKTRKQMVIQTLEWLGVRAELQLPPTNVEWYCKNVLEVLLLGTAGEMPPNQHPPPPEINNEQVNEAMFQMAKGRHIGEQQDKQFHKDPNKKAKLRPKRDVGKVSLREGANRLPLDERKDHELIEALLKYVPDLGVKL